MVTRRTYLGITQFRRENQFSLLHQFNNHITVFLPPDSLCLVSRSANISSTSSPVNMDILVLGILLTCELWLDLEGMCAEVVTLCLEKVGRQILGAVTDEPRQSGRESWSWDTEKGSLGNDISPSWLSLVDSLVEEVREQQVLEVWVGAVGSGDILQEDRADDTATTPHEGNRGLVELPLVFLGSLERD
jgi:hypothetical protein